MKISDMEFAKRLNECQSKEEVCNLFVDSAENLDSDALKKLNLPEKDSIAKVRMLRTTNTWSVLQNKVASKEFIEDAKAGKIKLDTKKIDKEAAAFLSIDKIMKEGWGGAKDFKTFVEKQVENKNKRTDFAKMVITKPNEMLL